ncbi:sugar transferase [Natribacillus halophilus]|uniref:Exopolysaccharide biosynthesis polyprenyl glycosylphosphotransferase n=1 Tax=Natribacillus halophilus TaxID=549003 RepID=A0A1G8SRL6_9BACI|nr:sugar transferase [Natribacillus halophilus]SDJ31892.1 exopolysaccharide biosynthesis polyprenyl glycosylphosphotransferase [Natribacillus halophilus]
MPDNSGSRNHKLIILLGDLGCILAAYIVAFYIRYGGFPQENWESFVALLPWILLIGLFFISVYELYALSRKNTIWDVLLKIFVAVSFMAFLTMAASYLFREFALPRSIILIASILTILFMVFWKMSYLKLIRRNVVGKVLLIGDGEEAKKMMDKATHPMLKGTRVRHIPTDTPIELINRYFRQVDYVLLCPNISKEEKSQIIYHAMECNKVVYVIPTLYELLMQRSQVTPLEDTLAMSVKPFGLTWDEKLIKRTFDIVASGGMLLVASPLLLLTTLLIKLESPRGSIIFKQERLGQNDQPFMMYKFRSMIEEAEKITGPTLATENDDRITKVGKWIRATRLDELPQLYNVLKGDMSLVGPRPERAYFIEQLAKQYYHYSYRNTVKPGITGYAQIMGKYSTEADDKLRFDLYYIRNYSFWLDIIILLKTFMVLFDKSKTEGAENEEEEEERSSSIEKKKDPTFDNR